MLTTLLAHIAIPLVAGLGLVFFVRAAHDEPISWVHCNEVALDFVLISIGATGALFLNPKLVERWGAGEAAIYGILIVLVNLFFAALLIYRSKHRRSIQVGPGDGFVDLFFGALGLMLTSLVYVWGYY